MQNLKIRVNNEQESKEAQELFFELGGKWGSGGCDIQHTNLPYLYMEGDLILVGFSDAVFRMDASKEITLPELRAMVNQEQDEPFLTPECTLNDQYAEIEKVRQAIKVKSGSGSDHALDAMSFGLMGAGASQASTGVDATLAERQSQYGCYEDVAQVTQQILSALRIGNYDELPAPMKESLHMIASKMARIVNGDPEYLDNWHDIGGYAKLIEKLIKGE